MFLILNVDKKKKAILKFSIAFWDIIFDKIIF